MLKFVALFTSLSILGPAHADSIAIPVDGESWSIVFEAPLLKPSPLPFRPRGFAYAGTAGRLNVSFFVETPSCVGGQEPSVRLACFTTNLPKNPYVVPESVRSSSTPDNGVFVVYGVRFPYKGVLLRQLHMHLLFHQDGKEIDFHASSIEPTEADAAELHTIIQSVRAVSR